MARIRSIKPEYWTSEQVMSCTRDARLLFIGMWNFCDDGGNHPASAMTLKAEVLPGDSVTAVTVMQWVDELIEQGLLAEYEVDGKEYWHVTGWYHQRIDQPTLRHPAGDTVTQGDAGDTASPKRLGGKQRQLLLKKLRERDGDACHLCGDASSLTLLRTSGEPSGNPHDASLYRLICSTCKRQNRAGDAQVTQGDARYVAGDSPTESSRVESSGEEGSKPTDSVVVSGTPVTQQVTRVTDDEIVPKDEGEWQRYFRERHSVELDATNIHDRKKAWPLFRAWIAAGVTIGQMNRAVKKAQEDSAEPIVFLPTYVDRVLATMTAPKKPKVDMWWLTNETMSAKAKSLGIADARAGEQPAAFKARIQQAIEARETA